MLCCFESKEKHIKLVFLPLAIANVPRYEAEISHKSSECLSSGCLQGNVLLQVKEHPQHCYKHAKVKMYQLGA